MNKNNIIARFVEVLNGVFQLPGGKPGWPVLALAGAICICLLALYLPAGLMGFAGFIYLVILLRDPLPASDGLVQQDGHVYAPIDGVILHVDFDPDRHQALVRMQASWLDSHLFFAPVTGLVDEHIWYDGKFSPFEWNADVPQTNARLETVFVTPSQKQIRLVCYGTPTARLVQAFIQEGRFVDGAQPIGLSLFMGCFDVIFKTDKAPPVHAGQRCLAGQTALSDRLTD